MPKPSLLLLVGFLAIPFGSMSGCQPSGSTTVVVPAEDADAVNAAYDAEQERIANGG